MASENIVILLGNLTRDPELKTTPNGQSVCRLSVATNRRWKTSTGELKDEATFTDVTVWGKSGEACAQYLRKGSPVMVNGYLRNNNYEKDGVKHYGMNVTANSVQFLGSGNGKSESSAAPAPAGAPATAPSDDDIPF